MPRRRRRPDDDPLLPDEQAEPTEGAPKPKRAAPEGASPSRRVRKAAWRMFPFRGRFLSPSTRYVYERLPEAPAAFSAADVAVLCVEADRALDGGAPCNPAEVIDLLTSRSLVVWTNAGFVKRSRPQPPPRA